MTLRDWCFLGLGWLLGELALVLYLGLLSLNAPRWWHPEHPAEKWRPERDSQGRKWWR